MLTHPMTLEDVVKSELGRGVTAILSHTVYYGGIYKRSYIEPYTCVSAVKRVLGIRSRLFTPKALYFELLKAGALPIKHACITRYSML
jgi:hypothetical protein